MPQVNISDIINQLQQAQAEANAANERRYAQALQELRQGRRRLSKMYGRASNLVSDLGQAAAQDINIGSQRSLAQGRQGLISSGLANTTITGSLMRGVEEDRARAQQRLAEQVGAQRSGLMTQRAQAEMGAAGAISDLIQSRADVGPDMGMYGSLIQAAMAQQNAPGPGNRIQTSGGLSPNARAGLDWFGRPLGGGAGGGGAGGGGAGGMDGGGGGGGQETGGARYIDFRERGGSEAAAKPQARPAAPATQGTMVGEVTNLQTGIRARSDKTGKITYSRPPAHARNMIAAASKYFFG